MTRTEVILKHKVYILNEFAQCCQLLSIDEQIHFADTMIKILPIIYNDETNIQIWTEIEYELYMKYRHKMRYFVASGFINHFFRRSDQTVMFFKKEMNNAEPYSPEEYDEFFIQVFTMLDNIKTFLYIADPESKGLSKVNKEEEKIILAPISTGKPKIFDSRPQQVLLMYYIAKGLGVRAKIEIPATKMAEFFHGLLGWEYSDINNSEIYKLLKKAPNIKTNERLLYNDLLWVKSQIELLGLVNVLEFIDKELKELEKHIH
jgi:hypothetical protein